VGTPATEQVPNNQFIQRINYQKSEKQNHNKKWQMQSIKEKLRK
jgi:hypothetical protein